MSVTIQPGSKDTGCVMQVPVYSEGAHLLCGKLQDSCEWRCLWHTKPAAAGSE